MWTAFRTLLSGALRDRISLFWSIAAPLALLFGLGTLFPQPEYRAGLVLGLLAFSSMGFALSGTGFEVMRQRTRGVYKLLRATPFRIPAFVGALAGARGLVSLASALAVAGVGWAAYCTALSAAGAAMLLAALIAGTACFLFLGFFLGNLGGNENQVAMYNNVLLLPQMFASEMFYSLDGAPEWVQAASRLMPASHFIDALRAAAEADGPAFLAAFATLLIMALFSLALAVATFRWDTGERRRFPALRRA